jgi:hypothetical protein
MIDVENEHGGCEPSLGALGSGYDCSHFDQSNWAGGGADDRELDDEREPSLGSLTCVGYCGEDGSSMRDGRDQTRWAHGLSDDREEQCEDEGAQSEDEGSAAMIED